MARQMRECEAQTQYRGKQDCENGQPQCIGQPDHESPEKAVVRRIADYGFGYRKPRRSPKKVKAGANTAFSKILSRIAADPEDKSRQNADKNHLRGPCPGLSGIPESCQHRFTGTPTGTSGPPDQTGHYLHAPI